VLANACRLPGRSMGPHHGDAKGPVALLVGIPSSSGISLPVSLFRFSFINLGTTKPHSTLKHLFAGQFDIATPLPIHSTLNILSPPLRRTTHTTFEHRGHNYLHLTSIASALSETSF
jgi:hypothetical protein